MEGLLSPYGAWGDVALCSPQAHGRGASGMGYCCPTGLGQDQGVDLGLLISAGALRGDANHPSEVTVWT